ncbi:transmembrane protein 255B [Archocentrus centrarchus]|uniref:transmembrane protein 255B n=1 Tax=Archocentrus centrarchus TaxID=63155 RepID=UPI0011E9D087|nr:transmembrane protein 255B [Archocentrus centrarchus]
MQQPETPQIIRQRAAEPLEPADEHLRRRRTALWVTVSLLALGLLALTIGLISATRTDNVSVVGQYPGIILSFGAFLGIVGIHLVENRRPMLVSAIIFISIGVVTACFCAIMEGIIASEFIDITPLQEGMCAFRPSGSGYTYDSYNTEVKCRSFEKTCNLQVRSSTCYCCYLYNCESEYMKYYYEFTGVSSCWDVVHLYRLMWTSVVLNMIGLFLGINTAAILGAYKEYIQKPPPHIAPSPTPAPHILYNPTQHMLTYPNFCPSGPALPAYPNYPVSMQHNTNHQAPATIQLLPPMGDPASSPSSCPSEENQSQPPSRIPPQPQPQGATQDPGGYMLTPNAPVLYASSYSAFEKPPPYAC